MPSSLSWTFHPDTAMPICYHGTNSMEASFRPSDASRFRQDECMPCRMYTYGAYLLANKDPNQHQGSNLPPDARTSLRGSGTLSSQPAGGELHCSTGGRQQHLQPGIELGLYGSAQYPTSAWKRSSCLRLLMNAAMGLDANESVYPG